MNCGNSTSSSNPSFKRDAYRRPLIQTLAIMTLHLGFFPDFKWSDSVLLSGTTHDIENLSLALGKFVESKAQQFPIHNLASIAPRHYAHLFAQSATSNTHHSNQPQFSWLCASSSLPDIQGKLLALARSGNGHQYFDLDGSDTQLVVSVGEYNDNWWQENG